MEGKSGIKIGRQIKCRYKSSKLEIWVTGTFSAEKSLVRGTFSAELLVQQKRGEKQPQETFLCYQCSLLRQRPDLRVDLCSLVLILCVLSVQCAQICQKYFNYGGFFLAYGVKARLEHFSKLKKAYTFAFKRAAFF